ncbi:hypothetical protein pb186bvf_020009 [Paramecium bursaria]
MEQNIQKRVFQIIPKLEKFRHKGQNGRIGIIGGSEEYTGAPFYSAISSLKGGGDLAYIFCSKGAAIPIKSYSPECIVYPLLISQGEITPQSEIQKYFNNLHTLVIGPGLGRLKITQQQVSEIIYKNQCIKVLDADGLDLLSNEELKQFLIKNSNQFILTPNKIELQRLFNSFNINYEQDDQILEKENQEMIKLIQNPAGYTLSVLKLSQALNNMIIIAKGREDIITNGQVVYSVIQEGSAKRCGGQGDVLSGLTGLYAFWSKEDPILGCVLASLVTRRAALLAYMEQLYSLTTPNIISKIGQAFQQICLELQE